MIPRPEGSTRTWRALFAVSCLSLLGVGMACSGGDDDTPVVDEPLPESPADDITPTFPEPESDLDQ